MMVVSPEDQVVLNRMLETIQQVATRIPKKTKFRQQGDPTNPGSPFPVMVPYSVPAQEIWPLLLEATVYIQRRMDPDHTEQALTELMRILVAINRNLLTYPGSYMYRRKKEKDSILEGIESYIRGEKELFIHGGSTSIQTVVDHVLVPITVMMMSL